MGVLRSIRRAAARRTQWLEKLSRRSNPSTRALALPRRHYRMESMERRLLLSADPLGAADQAALLAGLADLALWGEAVETHGDFQQFLPLLDLPFDPDLGIDERYLGAQLDIAGAFSALHDKADLYFMSLGGADGSTTDLVAWWNAELEMGWNVTDASAGEEIHFDFSAMDLSRDPLTGIDLLLGDDADALSFDFSSAAPQLNVDIGLSMDFDLVMVSADPSSFIIDMNSLNGRVDVHDAGVADFDLNVGILGLTVSGASFDLDADIALAEVATVLVAGGNADPGGTIPATGSHITLSLDGAQHLVRLEDVGSPNMNVNGLASDLQAAINVAGLGSQLAVNVDGLRIELASLAAGPESIGVDQAAPYATEFGFVSGVSADGTMAAPNVTLVATTEGPIDGKILANVSFDLVVDGADPVLVQVAASDTLDNGDVAALAADINVALTAAGITVHAGVTMDGKFLTLTTENGTPGNPSGLEIRELTPFAIELGFAPGAENSTVLTLTDLQNGDVDSSLSESATGTVTGMLPATARAGFNVGEAPAASTINVGGASLELFHMPDGGAPITLAEHYAAFAAASPADLIQPLLDLDNWLTELDASSVFGDQLPFLDGITVTDLVDLDGLFGTEVVDPLDTDGDGDYFDDDGKLDLRTVQELVALSGSVATITAGYDSASEELTIGLSLSDTGADTTSAFTPNIDLGPLVDLNNVGDITLTPDVGIDLTYGVDLATSDAPTVVAALETLIQQSGVLGSDAQFDLLIGAPPSQTSVSVTVSADALNGDLVDLTADINTALAAALGNAALAPDLITANIDSQTTGLEELAGPRVILTAQAGTVFTALVNGSADSAFTELGLGGEELVLQAAFAPTLTHNDV
ncbi:MAG: hypothetical protein ACI9F9_001160, partial [Candidatus Paceibacteria bacterium]